MELRPNQNIAISASINNDFKSGVHFHATGTGKSVIALEILLEFNKKYPSKNVIWICEQKSILIEQFDKKTLKTKGFGLLGEVFHILNFTINKAQDWYNSVNSAKFWWGKPTLLIINRCFLTSSEKYKLLQLPFHLVIHDESHTIINKTTSQFYQWILDKHPDIKCIGFSATPDLTKEPFTSIISKYSIYDGIKNNLIVPPKIQLFSSNDHISLDDIGSILPTLVKDLAYKKIIVWAGMIHFCYTTAEKWKNLFNDFLICVDTSSQEQGDFGSFEQFQNVEENAILFCASKHREGSDIKNLDCCVFIDGVKKRSSKTFIQCIGRVLRKDKTGKKTSGLIVDCKAKSSIECVNRVQGFLSIGDEDQNMDKFPWAVNKKLVHLNEKQINIHTLDLVVKQVIPVQPSLFDMTFTSEDIVKQFIRQVPSPQEYSTRLNHELQCLQHKNLLGYLLQAVEILQLIEYIPHVTRGSCGSSLVCYLLGISHVDPVKYNIRFVRFCNKFKDKLPDIDFDFPHIMRDEVFLKLEMRWPGKIARISNHVYFHKPSAIREAIRKIGYRQFIAKGDLNNFIKSLTTEQKTQFDKIVEELENTFRTYSLHCGGVVYFPDGVPTELKLKNKRNITQIISNKEVVSEQKQFKVDVLSSRALSQLVEAQRLIKDKDLLNFEEFVYDKKTFEMLARGDNIGITLAESPLMRKAFMLIKPETIFEFAIVMAIVRPAAKSTKQMFENNTNANTKVVYDPNNSFGIIFDDDGIDMLASLLECDDDEADNLRRRFSKGDKTLIKEIKEKCKNKTDRYITSVIKDCYDLRKYSFCKSHAYSYGQLIYKLAFVKANYPAIFWKSALHHAESSYKKWVHIHEAMRHSVSFKREASIYSHNRRKGFVDLSKEEQLRKYGYWSGKEFIDGCYMDIDEDDRVRFRGVIASYRKVRNTHVYFVATDTREYFEIAYNKEPKYLAKSIGCYGVGSIINKVYNIIQADVLVLF